MVTLPLVFSCPDNISIIEMSYLVAAMNYNYQLDYLENVCH